MTESTETTVTSAHNHEPAPLTYLVWKQGRIAIDDFQDYYEVASPGAKSVDGSEAFPVWDRPTPSFGIFRNSILDEAAAVADASAPFSEEAIQAATAETILDNSFAVTKSRLARQIGATIRSTKSSVDTEITDEMIEKGVKALDGFDYYDSQLGDYDYQRVKAILEAVLNPKS